MMRVRSLMVPPGFPDFLTRTRIVRRGEVELGGRAWSGRSAVTAVNISTDGGTTWKPAKLEAPAAPYAWQAWSYQWRADEPGPYELCCRAEDESGAAQPLEQHWTPRGMGNNMTHRVRVQVV